MRLLIVILNYKSTDLTIDCLRSLQPEVSSTPGFHVRVVENGTGGDAVPRLAEAIEANGWGAWADLRPQPVNLGFTGGNNVAIRESLSGDDRPEHILLLNSDTIVEPRALVELCDFMDSHPRAGIAGSLLLLPDGTVGPSPFRFLGVASELDRGLRVGTVHRMLSRWVDGPQPQEEARAEWVSGASMLLRRTMLEEIGLLDEGFFAYYEDIDLCLRAREAGWETWYVPKSRVYHLEGGSSGIARKLAPRPTFFYQGRRRYFLKHRGPVGAAVVDAAFLSGASVHALRSLLPGRSPETPAGFLADSFRYSVFGSGFRLQQVDPPRPAAGGVSHASKPPTNPYLGRGAGSRKGVGRRIIDAVPLGFWERAFPKDVVGLCYHVVSDEDLPHAKLYPYKSAAQFEADVEWARPRALAYGDIARRRRDGRGSRRNGVFFSFDDGFAECFDVARPILLRHRVDAAFFVTGDFLDDERIFAEVLVSLCLARIEAMTDEEARDAGQRLGLAPDCSDGTAPVKPIAYIRLRLVRLRPGLGSWQMRLVLHALQLEDSDDVRVDELCRVLDVDTSMSARQRPVFLSREQVRTLHADGFTIGAHAMRHLPLRGASEAEVEEQIVSSCAVVRDVTGQPRVPFAFPYGAAGVSRSLVASIRARNDFVDLIFDADGFERTPAFMVPRLWGDLPPPPGTIGTNLPEIIREGFAQRAAWYRDEP